MQLRFNSDEFTLVRIKFDSNFKLRLLELVYPMIHQETSKATEKKTSKATEKFGFNPAFKTV